MSDLLPATDGLLLGSDSRRWDASRLINVPWTGFEKVLEVVTASQVTSIVVNSLNLDIAKAYLLLFSWKGVGNGQELRLYFNDTTTGYNTEQHYATGSYVAAGKLANTSRFSYAYYNQVVVTDGILMRTPDNYTLVSSRSAIWSGSASVTMFHTIRWGNTANPTKIELQAGNSAGIDTGSRLIILKAKG